MKVIAVIPVRMAATRFPGKPLADIHGLPMVMHCYLRTKYAESISEVIIATCDTEIAATASLFGASVVMTSPDHLNAVDRCAEAVKILQSSNDQYGDIQSVVLVQGDEPLLDPTVLDRMIATLAGDPSIDVVNVMVPFQNQEDFMSKNNPKVTVSANSKALYISREPVPSNWRTWNKSISHMQTGLFAFRPSALSWFSLTPRTPIEEAESIDMLRFLYHGKPLHMLFDSKPSIGVDTPEELERARVSLTEDSLFSLYKY